MKRAFLILLGICLIIATIYATSLSVKAADTKGIYDGYLEYKITDGNVTITRCDYTKEGEVVIPSEIDGYPVIEIGGIAFWECTGITSITIPEGVTTIGSNAFWKCTNLKSITIPNSITSFDVSPFAECYSLEDIIIGDDVTCLDTSLDVEVMFKDTAYYQNEDNWENGLLYVGKNLVKAKPGLSGECVIREGTKNIVRLAFDNCSQITSITIPDSVTSIGWYAFNECTALQSMHIPDSVTTIGFWAFSGCSGISSIYIPDSVTELGNFVFSGCSQLRDIYCEAAQQPAGWRLSWSQNEADKGDVWVPDLSRFVYWGHTYEDYTAAIANKPAQDSTTQPADATRPTDTTQDTTNKSPSHAPESNDHILYALVGVSVALLLLKIILSARKKRK